MCSLTKNDSTGEPCYLICEITTRSKFARYNLNASGMTSTKDISSTSAESIIKEEIVFEVATYFCIGFCSHQFSFFLVVAYVTLLPPCGRFLLFCVGQYSKLCTHLSLGTNKFYGRDSWFELADHLCICLGEKKMAAGVVWGVILVQMLLHVCVNIVGSNVIALTVHVRK